MLKAFSCPRTRSAMLPATRWMPSSRAQARAAVIVGPSSGSAPASRVAGVAEQVPLLGQDDELGAVGGGGAHEALGDLEVAGLVARRVELYGGGAHLRHVTAAD